jgi:YqjK-like protein
VSNSLIDLQLRRGQLVERMAHQRADLSRDLAPVKSALASVDRARIAVRSGMTYLKQHPLALVLAVTGVAVLRPRRVMRLAGQGLVAWRSWRNLQAWVPSPLLQNLMNRLVRRYLTPR